MSTTQAKSGLTPRAKLAELIKACIQCGADNDGKITKTKLAKLVYLADFAYYYHNLEPITGVTYRKLARGPVSLDYFEELVSLIAEKNIDVEKKGNSELFFLIKEDRPKLDKSELKIVENVCAKWKGKKTGDIVDFTHKQLPWQISFDNDVIPYSLIIQEDEATLY